MRMFAQKPPTHVAPAAGFPNVSFSPQRPLFCFLLTFLSMVERARHQVLLWELCVSLLRGFSPPALAPGEHRGSGILCRAHAWRTWYNTWRTHYRKIHPHKHRHFILMEHRTKTWRDLIKGRCAFKQSRCSVCMWACTHMCECVSHCFNFLSCVIAVRTTTGP